MSDGRASSVRVFPDAVPRELCDRLVDVIHEHFGTALDLREPLRDRAPVGLARPSGVQAVVWDSRLAHGTDTKPRITQSVTMQPPGFWGESARDRIVLWETGRANPYYAGWPGFDAVQPWPPAELTPLGRRLLGLDEWPVSAARSR